MRCGLLFICLLTALWAIPVQKLVEQGSTYDKKTVTVTGEVIGNILYRKDCTWINILSREGVAIGIKTTSANIAFIKETGDYRHRGDIVTVTGTFYRFNKEELGETMILADSISLTEPGYVIAPPFSAKKAVLAALFLFLSLALSVVYTNQYLRQKKKTVPRS